MQANSLYQRAEIACDVQGHMEREALFGSRIGSIREAASLSLEKVAERAGISASYLGEIERGEKWPTLDMIERIATTLQVLPTGFFEHEAEEVDNNVLLSGPPPIEGPLPDVS